MLSAFLSRGGTCSCAARRWPRSVATCRAAWPRGPISSGVWPNWACRSRAACFGRRSAASESARAARSSSCTRGRVVPPRRPACSRADHPGASDWRAPRCRAPLRRAPAGCPADRVADASLAGRCAPRRARLRRRSAGRRPIRRAEQGPVPHIQVRGAEDQALRRLLLRRGAGRRRAGRADGRAVVCAACANPHPRTGRPTGADPLREPSRFRADQRHRRGDWRSGRRRDGVVQATDRAAALGVAGGDRPCHRPRTGPRLPVRHRHATTRTRWWSPSAASIASRSGS